MGRVTCFSETLASSHIDREAGIIFGVSVITEGPALGHDLIVDAKTLEQLKASSTTFSSGVKVKAEHKGGVSEILGVIKDFRVEGKKLIGDFHLLSTAQGREHVLELAEKMPDTFGLSVSFQGDPEGNKARCTKIRSVDLVADPAANPGGLFEEVDKCGRDMSKPDPTLEKEKSPKDEETTELADAAGIDALTARVEALEKLIKAAIEAEGAEQEKTKLESEEPTAMSAILAKLTEFSAKQEAMAELLKNTSSVSVSASSATGKAKTTTFSEKVSEYMATGKSRSEATRFAIEKHPDLHRTELSASGIFTKL
jgi:phage terminase small subunit